MTVTEAFTRCCQEKRKALMPFLTAGYPTPASFVKLVKEACLSGADMLEIGVPFTDPMADGKTIQRSSETALKNGITLSSTLDMLAGIKVQQPFILMSYFNPLYHYGFARLVKDARRSGIRGIIIPDLIPEEGREIQALCVAEGIDLIYLLAPTSSTTRRKMILRQSRGFVYLVTVAGVTGARQALPSTLNKWIAGIKKETDLPVCAGFGISTPEQARRIARVADGIIIGSALINHIDRAGRDIKSTGKFIGRLKESLQL